ncbi:MAG TPA: prolipoprotein diacylglyceryl transferase family protein [Syntrophales bacterium]|nr:prolipoprotein diacylglyceryl transferase family protein [Syntrophales bacterium]
MENEIFLSILAVLSVSLLLWGFKVLPDERWQIMATVPIRKIDQDRWDGVNLTYYGVFSANAYLASIVIMLILFGAIKIDIRATFVLILVMLVFCLPMARILAMVVERKAHTRTVGGAVFVGILVAPLAIMIVNQIMGPVVSIPIMPALAALAISYSFGEGVGRLACISFGCCYGKPLSKCSYLLQMLFRKHNFIFSGRTKKIAYEGGLEGEHVIPVQAVTAVVYVMIGLICTYLFLNSFYAFSFLLSVLVTQGWRFVSEIFRADYRGKGRISTYQIMGIGAIMYSFILWKWLPDLRVTTNVMEGIRTLWQPEVIIFLLLLWLGIFLHTGCSKVTGSIVSFHVHSDRI